ncbi:hypothetical protein SUGI_0061190 [Cryptomeria japonica]|uniref:uncharacterized protein LOC131031286 n=1 Tax=Cryptomeria japonica TaxID=3369 RepID=UPI0024089885|nr:uncharacterized protein LOC131031286 [Cryptomeria japonica]GLJ07192.1 hypothetical protein SUGI_0061190 [Cryptomeria japonica]
MEDPNSCEFRLVSAFLAMEPINILIPIARELGRGSITEEVQNFIHEECINNKICRNYPPSQFYVKSLLKQIIIDAESQSQEVLDVFYEKYAQYLINCKDYDLSQTGKCYRILKFVFPASSDFLTSVDNQRIRESVIMTVILRSSPNMLEGGTGCSIWPSSLFLSEFILSHPQIFSSKCCFEIGSGAGLVGICLANVKASKVILSDGDLSALANLKHNLEINLVVMTEKTEQEFCQDPRLVEYRHLKWESASQDDLQNCGAEVILGADIIYDTSCVPHLVRVLVALLRTRRSSDLKQLITNSKESSFEGMITEDNLDNNCNENKDSSIFCTNAYPVAYIATVIRNIDTFDYFLRLAFEAGLRVINITKVMGSLNLLPYFSSLDRSSVNLYRISSLHS